MVFSKNFPKRVKGSNYPEWVEILLSDAEEQAVESRAREENIKLFEQCISDAKQVFSNKDLKDYQTDVINAAIALFEKRASHTIYWKEEKAKQKFDSQNDAK